MERLAIVSPCYNEEEMLPISIPKFIAFLDELKNKGKIDKESYVLLVNDGSKDGTWELMTKWHRDNPYIRCINLSHNRGHQNALLAGMFTAARDADMIATLDCDLQDDYTKIEDMVDEYYKGFDIVYGVRSSRKTDTFFKRTTARSFYKFMDRMGVETVYDHADFRLMSKRTVLDLENYTETNVFLRALIPQMGYKSTVVTYERIAREAGESKYPLKKMISFAFDGITSFSVKPIDYIIGLGIAAIVICFAAAVYALISYFMGNVEHGWTSLILSIWFLGGIQLLCIGIIGEYIGKIYKEVKRRPKFTVETYLSPESDSADDSKM